MADKTSSSGKSAELNYPSHYANVLGSKMHYVEEGSGEPILLLHGLPTSSYVWRNIIPYMATLGRCIAVDLIGMGKSDKPDLAYTFEDHIRYVEEFIKVMKLKNITLVMHGWGSVMGFDYAMRHEDNCKGLVFYEAFLRPLQGDDLSLPFQEQQAILQKQHISDETLSKGTFFIDRILAQCMMHKLSPEELRHYHEPFRQTGEAAKEVAQVIKQYWHELPTGDGQSKVEQVIARYSKKLTQSTLPKLLLYSIPGFMTTISTVMWAKENLPHLEIGDVGEELHFAQETQPELMGELISAWLQAVEQEATVT